MTTGEKTLDCDLAWEGRRTYLPFGSTRQGCAASLDAEIKTALGRDDTKKKRPRSRRDPEASSRVPREKNRSLG